VPQKAALVTYGKDPDGRRSAMCSCGWWRFGAKGYLRWRVERHIQKAHPAPAEANPLPSAHLALGETAEHYQARTEPEPPAGFRPDWRVSIDGKAVVEAYDDEAPVVCRRPPKRWRTEDWGDREAKLIASAPALARVAVELVEALCDAESRLVDASCDAGEYEAHLTTAAVVIDESGWRD
jgi:hypothetical protein